MGNMVCTAAQAAKKVYYVVKHFGNYAKSVGGHGFNVTGSLERAKQFDTVGGALEFLGERAIAARTAEGDHAIIRVEETTTPGTKKLWLSSTLEPTKPTDRFVVITRHRSQYDGSDYGEVLAQRDMLARGSAGHGNYLKDFKLSEEDVSPYTFSTQLDAIQAVAKATFAKGLTFVGIRRLVIEESAPKVTRTETVLA